MQRDTDAHAATNSNMQKSESEITICSAYSSNDTKKELEINHAFVQKMNPGVRLRWLVAEASDIGETEQIDPKKFLVYEGLRTRDIEKNIGWRSVQHAGSLNKLFPHVRTRFLLILDPDFYVVRPHWIREVVQHMSTNGLAFFGSPWHPRDYAKPRYFLSTHFFCIDLLRVPVSEINFLPGNIKELPVNKKIPALARALITDRQYIGKSRDSGFRMYQKFFNRTDTRRDSFKPVFRPWKDWDPLKNILWMPNALIEFFLPERLCFLPKRRSEYSRKSFNEYGARGVADDKFEEYVWKDAPFAIHLRGTKAGYYGSGGNNKFTKDIEYIRSILDTYMTDRV
ncbi:MAG: hypothetical protein HYS59_01220 [Candidatus Vogelbacteria bacterium]|nr:hypothetical protein [Candidatus Vogelbacteria bacterium]